MTQQESMLKTMPFLSARHALSLSIAGLLLAAPALAQAACVAGGDNFCGVNMTIAEQFAAAPILFKQISVLVSLITVCAGIYGFYNGAKDPRSAAPLKHGFLLLIGGMILAFSFIAQSAEKSVFGTNDNRPTISGSTILNSKLKAF